MPGARSDSGRGCGMTQCRVHPDVAAEWQAGELCSTCRNRLRAAARRIARCQPLTRAQMETVQGMGRPPMAVLQLFDVPAMRQAGTGPAGYGTNSRCRKRPGRAYGLRAVNGYTWQVIAIKLGYSSAGNCLNAAKRYAAKNSLPFPPVPSV